MHFKLLNPSKYLGAADFLSDKWRFGKEPTLTIQSVAMETIEEDLKAKTTEVKGLIQFSEQPKGWLMNVTNATCLAAMFGDDTTAWVGKRVTLRGEKVLAFGDWTIGIRVKGSPDLAAAKSITLKQRKKKTLVVNLVKTSGAKTAGFITFGPFKGAKISEMEPAQLAESIALAEKNIAAAKPEEKWLPKTRLELEELKADLTGRTPAPEPEAPQEEATAPF